MGTCLPINYSLPSNMVPTGSISAAQIAAGSISAAQIAAGTITAAQIASGSISGQTTFNDVARVLPLLKTYNLGPKSTAALAPLLDYFSDDPQLPDILPKLIMALLAAMQEEKPVAGYPIEQRGGIEHILRKLAIYTVMYAG